jgi:hypothetical protein
MPVAASRLDHMGTGAVAALVGASTFIPLPLVDDWVASLSRRQLVAGALKRHDRTFPVGELKPLYTQGGTIWGLPFRFVKGLVLLPFNKILKKLLVVFAVRDVGLAVGKTIALGHTLERQLNLGMFRNDDSPATRRHDATRLQKAFSGAYQGIDQRIVLRAAKVLVTQLRQKVDPDADASQRDVEGFLEELDRRVDQRLHDVVR